MTPAPHMSHNTMRQLWRLSLPALPVLAAEPLYVLVDTALVGHLGAVPMAALAAAGTVLAVLSSQLTFLSYGTTARAARFHGKGDTSAAQEEGLQASWLALGVGLLIVIVMYSLMGPITTALLGHTTIAAEARSWLRIALFGVPFILLSMAGNGWMRGIQDVRTPLIFTVIGWGISAVLCPILIYGVGPFTGWGLRGSAVANLIGQTISGVLFVSALVQRRRSHALSLAPRVSIMKQQLHLGKDLIVRSLGFQVCFLSLSAVAARLGAPALAAHHIVWQLSTFTYLILDSLAIGAQSLIGASLGQGEAASARQLSRRIVIIGTLLGVLCSAIYAAGRPVFPLLFTNDSHVLASISIPWWFFVALLPIAGATFASDGVLLGASDAAFLRNVTASAAFLLFLPAIWLSYIRGWGLAGLWAGYAVFLSARALCGLLRQARGKWAITGVPEQ